MHCGSEPDEGAEEGVERHVHWGSEPDALRGLSVTAIVVLVMGFTGSSGDNK